jgi:RNA polymerase sigma-70 factor (ECF subfamily)
MSEPDDARELDRLVREHLPTLLRTAVRLTGRTDAAEELVQETLGRAARSWRTFRGEASFRTWLYRVLLNAFRDRVSQNNGTTFDGELEDHREPEPSRRLMQQEFERLVAERVSALPPRQREVLVLVAYEGLDAAETARLLGVSEANVHSTLHVARSRLKAELASYLREKD